MALHLRHPSASQFSSRFRVSSFLPFATQSLEHKRLHGHPPFSSIGIFKWKRTNTHPSGALCRILRLQGKTGCTGFPGKGGGCREGAGIKQDGICAQIQADGHFWGHRREGQEDFLATVSELKPKEGVRQAEGGQRWLVVFDTESSVCKGPGEGGPVRTSKQCDRTQAMVGSECAKEEMLLMNWFSFRFSIPEIQNRL